MLGLSLSDPLCAQRIYALSEESNVKISGTSSVADWTVTGRNLIGRFAFKEEAASRRQQRRLPTGMITEAEAQLNVADIHSEKGEAMDSKVYKALKIDEYPTIRFTLKNPIEIKDSIQASGSISMAGIKRDFSFDLLISYKDDEWQFTGKKRIKMSDFEIEPPSAMFGQITTGDDVEIDLMLIYRGELK